MLSRLKQTIQQYKAELKAREASAERALEYAHQQTLALINAQLDLLYRQMSDAITTLAEGETLPASWLYESKRLQSIEQYISGQVDHFGALTQMQVTQLQYQGVQLGQQAAQALLQAVTPPGVSMSFGIPSPDAIAGMIGATQKGSPLADLFSGFGAEAAQGAKTALISGVTLGYGPRQIAPSVQDALDISRYRALTIARTEMLRSYRDANTATFQANSDVVDQWRWTCDLSVRTCAACIAMDGTLHDVDETLDSHVNCRCTPIPVTKSWDDILGNAGIDSTGIEDTNPAQDMQTGSDWFDNQSEDVQRQILGNAKYEAYQNGDITLQDLIGTSHSDDWGNSIYERSLKDALAAADSTPEPIQRGDIPPIELSAAETTAWIERYLQESVPPPPTMSDAELQKYLSEFEPIAATKVFTPLEGGMAAKETYLAENGLNDWLNSLSHTEKAALGQYTGNDYREINRYLRGITDTISANLQKTIDGVQQALLKFEAPTDFTTIRGYGMSQLEAFKEALANKGTFIEQGFVSTTLLDKPTFSGFRVIVQVFEGAPGSYIKDVSYFSSEREYLLPYGAEFKVIDGFTNPGGDKWTFVVEYRGIAEQYKPKPVEKPKRTRSKKPKVV